MKSNRQNPESIKNHTRPRMTQTLLASVFLIIVSILLSACEQGTSNGNTELSAGVATATQNSLEKYGQPFEGKIAKSYEESEEWWPSTPKPPAGTPNVIIFLLDDTGFAHQGSFGGLIETPAMDKLAANGLRFNNFHTTALCSPSRAAIMAGRNHHRIGLGSHSLTAMGFPGYNAFAPESAKSVAGHLQKAGFVNYALGK